MGLHSRTIAENIGSRHQHPVLILTRFNMAKSRRGLAPARHSLGLFMFLAAGLLLANIASARVLAAADGQAGDPDYTCSADKPCAIGCCGTNGICGMGPDYCSAANCINSCDAKSECDPSNWGPQYAASEKCPLNVRSNPPRVSNKQHQG